MNVDSHAGRFVSTGSVSGVLEAVSWLGTGRLVRPEMFGLTVRERLRRVDDRSTVDDLLRGHIRLPPDRPDLVGYVDLTLVGGFPEVIRLDDAGDRRMWLDSYAEQLVTRDVARVSGGRGPERLRRYLQAWALSSAELADDVTIYSAVGIEGLRRSSGAPDARPGR